MGVSVSRLTTSGNAMLPSPVTMPVHDTKQNAPQSGRCSYMPSRGAESAFRRYHKK